MGRLHTEPRARSTRLDSWKSIAHFLGRSLRTVQRWHVHFGLPVYRVAGDKSSVFAFEDELDEWLIRHSGASAVSEAVPPQSARSREIAHVPRSEVHSRAGGLQSVAAVDPKTCANALVESGYSLWRTNSTRTLPLIAQSFRQAADFDAQNPSAYAGLAHALIAQRLLGMLNPEDADEAARAAAERGFELDRHSAETRSAMAWAKLVTNRDWNAARSLFEPLVHEPNVSGRTLVGWAILKIGAGRIAEGTEFLSRACLMDPLIPARWGLRAWADYLRGDYLQARNHIRSSVISGNQGPILCGVKALLSLQTEVPEVSVARIEEMIEDRLNVPLLRGALGYANAKRGDHLQARTILRRLADQNHREARGPFYAVAMILTALGEYEEAVRALESCFSQGSLWSFGFHSDPLLRPLKQHPRFRMFLQRSYPLDHGSLNNIGIAACPEPASDLPPLPGRTSDSNHPTLPSE